MTTNTRIDWRLDTDYRVPGPRRYRAVVGSWVLIAYEDGVWRIESEARGVNGLPSFSLSGPPEKNFDAAKARTDRVHRAITAPLS